MLQVEDDDGRVSEAHAQPVGEALLPVLLHRFRRFRHGDQTVVPGEAVGLDGGAARQAQFRDLGVLRLRFAGDLKVRDLSLPDVVQLLLEFADALLLCAQFRLVPLEKGLDDLLEMVALVAEMKELRANPDRAAKGTVIEARLDKGRGPVATVLVQNGTLHKGDIIIAGTSVGRVRVMMNDKGESVQEAGPSVPVEITGLDEVPVGGDTFDAVSDERLARTLVEQRRSEKKEEIFNAQTKVTLDNLFDQLKLGEVKELQIIVKADVQGSVEAVKQSLEKLSNEEVRVNVIHGAVGAINESDVMLADASGAIIVGFNVRPDAVASANAERSGVDMRLYSVIYDCINEIEAAMKGMLAPKTREVVLGMAECRNVIKIKSVGTIAGSYVKSGKIQRGAKVRVIRDGIVIADDAIGSLQRFKDAVKEVNEGYECGIGLEKFNDLKENDMFEVYTIEEYRD